MQGAPWANSAHSYAGWVPNVGSHLSFSLIGEAKGPDSTSFSQKYDGRIARMVAVMQHRETDDFLLPPRIMRLILPDIAQHWLLVGTTVPVHAATDLADDGEESRPGTLDDQGMLHGVIHSVPYQPRTIERILQEWGLAEIGSLLRSAYSRLLRSRPLSDRELDALVSELARAVRWRTPHSRSIRFALMRTGELRLWYDDPLPKDGREARMQRTMARQAYFFMKDMVHHHTHHDASSDQITPLVQVNAADPTRRSAGERKWRRETAWSLSRTVETLMRTKVLDDKRQALGILAYADAFQKTLFGHARDHDDPRRFVRGETVYGYDFSHIRESLKVQIERKQVRRTHVTAMLVAALASSIAAMSMLSSLVSTRNNAGRVSSGENFVPIPLSIPDPVLAVPAAYPLGVVGIVFVFVLLISAIVTDDGARLLQKGPRRSAQTLRGITLSVTRTLGFGARFAHSLLILCYASSAFAISYAAVSVPEVIVDLLAR